MSAILLGPFQPFLSSAHAAEDSLPVAEESIQRTGMKALSELEMASVSGQGVMTNYERLLDIVDSDLKSDEDVAATTLESLASSLIPGTNLLDSDVEISGVEYEPGPRTTINADGSLDIQLPTNIKQIAFRNVRVAGSEGQHMGDVIVRDLSFGAGTSVKIHLR